VRVEHHLAPAPLQAQAGRDQLRIVQLVDVGVEAERGAQHPAGGAQHALQAPARTADVEDAHAVGPLLAQAVRHDQGDLMPASCQAAALLDEDPRVVAGMG